MSTGPEHYRRAEQLLADADDAADSGHQAAAGWLAIRAQAHATLAHAAATALNDAHDAPPLEDYHAWREACGEFETRLRREAGAVADTTTEVAS